MQTIMYYFYVGAALLGCAWLFPSMFWRKSVKNSDVNIVFFEIERDSENPFLREATKVTMYDLRKELVYTASNASTAETSDELERLVYNIISTTPVPIFVTFDDTGFKKACLKHMLQDVEGAADVRVMDIKTLFYYTNPNVPRITYDEMVEYYSMTLTNIVVDYANLFTYIALDYNPNIMHQLGKINDMYEDIKQLY